MSEPTGITPPHVMVTRQPIPGTNRQFIGMVVMTETTSFQFMIADTDTYEDAASNIYKQIIQAGKDAKRDESGLVVAKEGALDVLNGKASPGRTQQGRQQPRSR